ncbi:MAG: ribosome small subunit-dependent GTPase A [Clostridia bacterium]|nr:ribosome small subunit-dependent GTPase A [Clostridia bacterium]
MNGIIVKAIAGFYYVDTGDGIFECKARGIFRKNGQSPLVGDRVVISLTDGGKGIVENISARKNALVRPPVANIDRLFVVVSTVDPAPNTYIIDRVIANAENSDIEPIVIINKCDIKDGDDIYRIYKNAGFNTFMVSAQSGEGIDAIRSLIADKTVAFTGNSGVGKSSILNMLDENLNLAVGDISKKLGRGRHTTRHVELYPVCDGYIVDTPGFSSFDMEQCDVMRKEQLQYCFREFAPYIGECKFTSCSHTKEKGCKIVDAVNSGEIAISRHESYVQLYKEAALIPDWQRDKSK